MGLGAKGKKFHVPKERLDGNDFMRKKKTLQGGGAFQTLRLGGGGCTVKMSSGEKKIQRRWGLSTGTNLE